MRERHVDPTYDRDHIGPCEVLAHSPVDTWAGTDLSDGVCKARATHVIFEEGDEDPSWVCAIHAEAWVREGEVWFHEALDSKPVTDDEVQAAIASILGSAS